MQKRACTPLSNTLRSLNSLAIVLATALAVGTAYADVLVNDNSGATGTSNFTQSESSIVVFGSTVIVGYNDSGTFTGPNNPNNQFTGFARSTDGGLTFTDMGKLPPSTAGDAGDPFLARDTTTGRIYMLTEGFTSNSPQLFRSTDNGITWSSPSTVIGGLTATFDKSMVAVDNFAGLGNGNVYVIGRDFGSGNGIFVTKSTDGGVTFSGPALVQSGSSGNVQGGWVTVAPDHSIDAFWYDSPSSSLQMRRSTDGGVTFSASATVASVAPGGVNGDLGLTGIRSGTVTSAGFRSFQFTQVVVDPVTGELFAIYNDKGAGSDNADIYLVTSTDNGVTWSAPIRVNSDGTTNDQFNPNIAITPDGTHLGIFWYDRRNDPLNNLIQYYGRTCGISGTILSCGADFAVSDVSFLPEFGRDVVVNTTYMGDYDVAQADNNFFYVSWGDNRLSLPGGGDLMDPNVFFDTVAVGEASTVPEPSTLAMLSLALGGAWVARRRRAQ